MPATGHTYAFDSQLSCYTGRRTSPKIWIDRGGEQGVIVKKWVPLPGCATLSHYTSFYITQALAMWSAIIGPHFSSFHQGSRILQWSEKSLTLPTKKHEHLTCLNWPWLVNQSAASSYFDKLCIACKSKVLKLSEIKWTKNIHQGPRILPLSAKSLNLPTNKHEHLPSLNWRRVVNPSVASWYFDKFCIACKS